jgi:hypothetical protein
MKKKLKEYRTLLETQDMEIEYLKKKTVIPVESG